MNRSPFGTAGPTCTSTGSGLFFLGIRTPTYCFRALLSRDQSPHDARRLLCPLEAADTAASRRNPPTTESGQPSPSASEQRAQRDRKATGSG
jgi:hypothetical protein